MARHLPLTERDRAAANEVTVQGRGHVFEIQLGHLCNNRCVFCSSGMLTAEGLAKPVPLEPILEAISEAKAAGARRLIFLGGEPTLHKGFLAALEHTVKVGFEDVVIFTNGVSLPRPGFVDAVTALGTFEWRISIQGSDEESHVAVTGRKQSFAKIVQGLRMLRERGQRVTVNLCVNEKSYRSLPGYPALVDEHDIQQLHVDIIRPSSAGPRTLEYFQSIMPRYTDMAPYFERMLEGFEAMDPDFDVSVGNIPYCTLRGWPSRIHHGGEDTVTVAADETGLEEAVDKYRWHFSMRRHVDACESCAMKSVCSGVFETYLEIHGEDELVPLRIEELTALPPRRQPFFLLLRTLLAPLLEDGATPPGPWRAGRRFEDERARVFGLTFVDPRGRRVSVRFSEPGGLDRDPDGAPVVARAPAWRLALVVDRGVSVEALAALVAWVDDRIPERPGNVDIDVVAAVHRVLALYGTPADARSVGQEHSSR